MFEFAPKWKTNADKWNEIKMERHDQQIKMQMGLWRWKLAAERRIETLWDKGQVEFCSEKTNQSSILVQKLR